MQTIFQILEGLLTPDEAIELRNVRAHLEAVDPFAGMRSRLNINAAIADEVMATPNILIARLIQISFDWQYTPQGQAFWAKIYAKYAMAAGILQPASISIN